MRIFCRYTTDMNEEPREPWWPVGIADVAGRLGVSVNTVMGWRRRSAKEWVNVPSFPDSNGQISGREWWWWKRVEDWARETGRLKSGHTQGTTPQD